MAETLTKPWEGTSKELLERLQSSNKGLTDLEAQKRLLKYGTNVISRKTPIPYFRIFLDQFLDLMVILLVAAALLSFALGDARNGTIITAIIFLNAIIGFAQEYKAEKILKALKKILPERVKVKRDGLEKEVSTHFIVPGDIVILGEGDRIPADVRFLESYELKINEQVLTGEAEPKSKSSSDEVGAKDMIEAENVAFMGTTIVSGEALGLVAATGQETEFGKIAEQTLKISKTLSPLQEKTHRMAKRIALLAIAIMVLMVIYQYLTGRAFSDALIFSVAVAAALVPEGLPATVSVALSLGASNLAKKKALVKNLVSVETLGSVTVICSDKTGTLTTGKMAVSEVWRNPSFEKKDEIWKELTAKVMILCNDAELGEDEDVGDPTEIALLRWADKEKFDIKGIRRSATRKSEVPFSSERRYMSVEAVEGDQISRLSKGAPEIISEQCHLSGEELNVINKKYHALAEQGMRVLAISADSVFLGLVAIFDPPRPEVAQAIETCQKGNIRVIMLTGDNPLTAKFIAQEVGIIDGQPPVVATGDELERMDDIELRNFLRKAHVFARILPRHKFRIVDNLMKNGDIVAVTGDGVNDAPALKRADIGVSMGIAGTDVSKESADMVLLDDNFSTIVVAVREGRVIFDNIKKFLFFIFAHNFGELGIVILGIALGLPLPMLAVQILAVDLGTDVLPSMSLIGEKEEGVMDSKPRSKEVQFLSGESFIHLFIIGAIVGVGAIINFQHVLSSTGNYPAATTISFTTLAICQAFYVFFARTGGKSVFKYPFWKNKYLLGAVAVSLLILSTIIYWPTFNRWFETAPFPIYYWTNVVIVGIILVIVEEIYKLAKNSFQKA